MQAELVKADPHQEISAETMEKVLLGGDLSKLGPAERLIYYQAVCKSLGLNPLTKPFSYLQLQGRLTLYATRECTEQLRQTRGVSITIEARELVEGVYVVTAKATTPDGRTDTSIGAVPIEGLKGDSRSNAMMKAETKAKRRVTMSICGLSFLDESEIDSVKGAHRVNPDEPIGSKEAAQESAQKTLERLKAGEDYRDISGGDPRVEPRVIDGSIHPELRAAGNDYVPDAPATPAAEDNTLKQGKKSVTLPDALKELGKLVSIARAEFGHDEGNKMLDAVIAKYGLNNVYQFANVSEVRSAYKDMKKLMEDEARSKNELYTPEPV